MPINISVYDDIYFTEAFRAIIRSCKEIIIDRSSLKEIIDTELQFVHRNNFYSYLRRISEDTDIDERLLWTIAFINDINDPGNWYPRNNLYIPTLDVIDDLIAPLKTIHKK